MTRTEQIIECLRQHFTPLHGWVFFDELRCGTGWGLESGVRSEQRLDAWAMNCWNSRRVMIAYEVKATRADFLKEIEDPNKRLSALRLSNQFYFVTPPELVVPAEVPEEAGLLYISAGGRFDCRKQAPWRPCADPPWAFIATLARRMLLQMHGRDSRSIWDLVYNW